MSWKVLGALLWAALKGVLGIFLAPKTPDPATTAQEQKDRADVLQSELTSKVQSDQEREDFERDLVAHPDKLREHDEFERRD